MMRLHGYWRSSAAWRVRIALALKGVEAEQVPVHLVKGGQLDPAFRALNPQGLIPVLEVDGAALTQSLAIIEWLEERHPVPPLLPGDATMRAHIRAFAYAIACEIHPLQNLRVQQYLKRALGADTAAVQGWLETWLGEGLGACEALLADRPAGAFAFGEPPTLADVVLAPQLASARRFGVSLDACPRLVTLGEAYARHPAFIAADAVNQPDAEG